MRYSVATLTYLSLITALMLSLGTVGLVPQASVAANVVEPAPITVPTYAPKEVPFFSQFTDISSPKWQKVGCGIASLAMIIEYYEPGSASVDTLLAEGIELGAYSDAGWTYKGLIDVSGKYGFTGESHDLAGSASAYADFKEDVAKGPVIASVYYTFTPGHPIPHLVVVNKIEGDTVYYNDPAEQAGGGTISVDAFTKAWKKRYIEIYPAG